MSLVRRGVTALITDGCARKPRDDARSHQGARQHHHGAGHRERDRRIRRARDRPQRSFLGETAEGWGMNFAAHNQLKAVASLPRSYALIGSRT